MARDLAVAVTEAKLLTKDEAVKGKV